MKRSRSSRRREVLEDFLSSVDDISDDSSDEETEDPEPPAAADEDSPAGAPAPTMSRTRSKPVAEDKPSSSGPSIFVSLAMAAIFISRLRTRVGHRAVSAPESKLMVSELQELVLSWLKKPLRPLIQSILSDTSLTMGLVARRGAGGKGLFSRSSGPSKKELSDAEEQAKRLKVRTKAVLDAVLLAVPTAPSSMVRRLHYLTTRRVYWPDDDGFALYPSERSILRQNHDGSFSSTEESPRVMAANLIFTRALVLQLVLRPKENQLAPGVSTHAMPNLRMLAALLYFMALGNPPGLDEDSLATMRARLEQDAHISQPFAAELERLLQAPPSLGLQAWAYETAKIMATCLRALMRRGATVAQGDVDDA